MDMLILHISVNRLNSHLHEIMERKAGTIGHVGDEGVQHFSAHTQKRK